MATAPPAQITSYAPSTSTFQIVETLPGLRMRFYSRVQSGLNVGPTAVGTYAGGDTTTNGVVLHASMNWLVEYISMAAEAVGHGGTKAYPDQVA